LFLFRVASIWPGVSEFMTSSRQIILNIAIVFLIAVAALFFFEYGLDFLSLLAEPTLRALFHMGQSIAGMAGSTGFPSQLVFVVGNFVLTCIVFLTTRFYLLLKGKHSTARLVIYLATLITGLSVIVVQAGFCVGFHVHSISEFVKSASKILLGLECMLIFFAPLYFSQQAKRRQSLHVNKDWQR